MRTLNIHYAGTRSVIHTREFNRDNSSHTNFALNFRLLFDEKTNKLKNVPGVEIRVPGFGETYTVEYLDDEKAIPYFASMVERMVSWGYERGVSVRAAPYDYRYGPGK